MARPKKKPDPKATPGDAGTTRVRLDLSPDEHAYLRVAAAKANVSMARYARALVQEDMRRWAKPKA